jgi:MoaA/NifB/PqqE/SkfB family radical SAM enzyme
MKEKDIIALPKMMEILEDFWSMGVKAITYSGGGEPLMHPNIVEIMQATLDYGIDLSIITNGQNLAKERAQTLAKAKWVRVSMDYTNAADMKRFRNVPEKSFDAVIRNINHFAAIKDKTCDLGVNYIVHRNNYKNLWGYSQLLKEAGVENIRFSPMYVPDFYAYHQPIEDEVNEQLAKIQSICDERFTVNSTYNIKPGSSHSTIRSYNKCYVMQTIPVVGADLAVYACHNKAYDGTGKIGSIANQRFKDMWFSDKTKEYMESFNPKTTCMHECSNDRKNILINQVMDTSPDNFI